jgi:hypothetical protein
MKRTWKYLRLFAITGLVGFGICWGFQLITTVHGLVGESDQSLYNTRIRQGYIIGLCAAGLWLYRRLRDLRLRWWERAEFAFATFFIA